MKTFKTYLTEKHLPHFIILKGDNIVDNTRDLKDAKKKAKELDTGDPRPSQEVRVYQQVQFKK
jgi:hypothetical protein